MRFLSIFIISLLVLQQGFQSARAHIAVKSNSGNSSAIVHVSPDDDPIAGSDAMLFFDIRSNTIHNDSHDFVLKIKREGESDYQTYNVDKVGKHGVLSKLIFETRGRYDVSLTAFKGGDEEEFEFSQFVSRGVSRTALPETSNNSLAEMGAVLAISSFLGILIILINRHKHLVAYIVRQSQQRRK